MRRNIDILFFDLGNTLIYGDQPWAEIYSASDQALVDELQRLGYQVDRQVFIEEFVSDLQEYYRERDISLLEYTTEFVLQMLMHEFGYNLPQSHLRSALNAMYAVTQRNWFLEADAIPTLNTLRDQGYRLGLISNASDGEDVRTILKTHQLTGYFDPIIISAEVGIRKPHSKIFAMALELSKTTAGKAVMVGDTFNADILGAKNIGIRAVWITRRVVQSGVNQVNQITQPDATISLLDELPDLLQEWG